MMNSHTDKRFKGSVDAPEDIGKGLKDSYDPEAALAKSRHEFGEFGGVCASIEISSTFTVLQPETLPALFNGTGGQGCYLYARCFSPTVQTLARSLAAMEGTEAAYCCASGMAAISSTLLQLCNAGDHIVSSRAVYGGTHALLKTFLPAKCHISTTFVPIYDLDAVEAAIQPNTKVLYAETCSNPTVRVANVPALAAIARRHNVKLVMDNTFCPMLVTPAHHGADIVIHSLTKFISGESDLIAGCICGPKSFIESLMNLNQGCLMLLGPTMDARIASQLLQRIPSLSLRIQESSRRALRYAELLESLGARVAYPGLQHHPEHELFTRLKNDRFGYGGIFNVDMGSIERANRFMDRLQNVHAFGWCAVSLGFYDTLFSCSGSSTSSELDKGEQTEAGISPGLVRISAGITGEVVQRCEQLREAYLWVVENTPAPPTPITNLLTN